METGQDSTSQDAGRAGKKLAVNVLPPFTPADLYGTRYDRLLFISKINYQLAQSWYRVGHHSLSADFFRVFDHYSALAATCRPDGVEHGEFSSMEGTR